MCFLRGKKQKTKSVARPAIVFQPFFKAWFLGQRLLVYGGDFAGGLGGILQSRVIGLDAPLQRIDERHGAWAEIQHRERAAVGGFAHCCEFGRSDFDFLAAVRVEIELGHKLVGLGAVTKRVCNRLGANEVAPQFRSEVRGIEPAENSVPVGIIAL